jgi:hypothetical protein
MSTAAASIDALLPAAGLISTPKASSTGQKTSQQTKK